MARSIRRNPSASQPFTVVLVHRTPPDAEARLARAARTCLSVALEQSPDADSVCESDRIVKKAG